MGGDENHWDRVYGRKAATDVSWFQPSLTTSIALIEQCQLPRSASIIDVGGGASTLVDDLLGRGYENVSVLDISERALETAKARLGARADTVQWIVADIATVTLAPARYDLWHDRAVFHFLTDPSARQAYVETAARALKPDAHIIVATFGTEGPEQCSGLDVVRYDAEGLHGEFGSPFERIRCHEESHTTPWGSEQEFLYCYCKRKA